MWGDRIWFAFPLFVLLGIFLFSTFFVFSTIAMGETGSNILAMILRFLPVKLDKVGHFCSYFLLGVSSLYAFKKNCLLGGYWVLGIFVVGNLYGLLLETLQSYFFPYRVFDWLDGLSNVLGLSLSILIFKKMIRK